MRGLIDKLSQKSIELIISKQAIAGEYSARYFLQARERLTDRLYYLIDQAFVPKQADWLTVKLPKILHPAYFVLRPIRLFKKFSTK